MLRFSLGILTLLIKNTSQAVAARERIAMLAPKDLLFYLNKLTKICFRLRKVPLFPASIGDSITTLEGLGIFGAKQSRPSFNNKSQDVLRVLVLSPVIQ